MPACGRRSGRQAGEQAGSKPASQLPAASGRPLDCPPSQPVPTSPSVLSPPGAGTTTITVQTKDALQGGTEVIPSTGTAATGCSGVGCCADPAQTATDCDSYGSQPETYTSNTCNHVVALTDADCPKGACMRAGWLHLTCAQQQQQATAQPARLQLCAGAQALFCPPPCAAQQPASPAASRLAAPCARAAK